MLLDSPSRPSPWLRGQYRAVLLIWLDCFTQPSFSSSNRSAHCGHTILQAVRNVQRFSRTALPAENPGRCMLSACPPERHGPGRGTGTPPEWFCLGNLNVLRPPRRFFLSANNPSVLSVFWEGLAKQTNLPFGPQRPHTGCFGGRGCPVLACGGPREAKHGQFHNHQARRFTPALLPPYAGGRASGLSFARYSYCNRKRRTFLESIRHFPVTNRHGVLPLR